MRSDLTCCSQWRGGGQRGRSVYTYIHVLTPLRRRFLTAKPLVAEALNALSRGGTGITAYVYCFCWDSFVWDYRSRDNRIQ